MKIPLITSYTFFLLIGILFVFSSCENKEKIRTNKKINISEAQPVVYKEKEKAKQIDQYFTKLNKRRAFNGNVLVAQNSKVIFEKSFGYTDIRTKEPLKLNSVFQLGSVSKQFTAVAILQLLEQAKIDLQDSIQKFYPDFPYKGINIHQLLCHRSGLMNYIYFSDNQPIDKSIPLSNSGVIKSLTDSFPSVYYTANRRYDYSNTGYMILAAIVEKVSGLSFRDYMGKYIFKPLQMKDSYVYNHNTPYKHKNLVKGYEYGRVEANPDFLDGVVGDKGVYSTINDMFLWDQGLYQNKIIKKETLDMAFEPSGKRLTAKKNYGYGWRMYYMPDSTKILYHAGWWHGYQSLLVRKEKDKSTIAILKNKRNRTIIDQNYLLEILDMK